MNIAKEMNIRKAIHENDLHDIISIMDMSEYQQKVQIISYLLYLNKYEMITSLLDNYYKISQNTFLFCVHYTMVIIAGLTKKHHHYISNIIDMYGENNILSDMIHGFIYAREENLYILLKFIKRFNRIVNVLYEEEYQLYEDDTDKLNHMFSVGVYIPEDLPYDDNESIHHIITRNKCIHLRTLHYL